MSQERHTAVTFQEDTVVRRRPELVNDKNMDRIRQEAADYESRKNFVDDMAIRAIADINLADTPARREIVAKGLIQKVEIMLPQDSEEQKGALVLEVVDRAIDTAPQEILSLIESKQDTDEAQRAAHEQAQAQRIENLTTDNERLKSQMRIMSTEVMKALQAHPEARMDAFTVLQNLDAMVQSIEQKNKLSPFDRLNKGRRIAAAGIKSFFSDLPRPHSRKHDKYTLEDNSETL